MSTYVSFFIRKGDEFIPVGDFSRNTKVYEIANNRAPDEHIRAFTYEMLECCEECAKDEIQKVKEYIRKEEEQISIIGNFANTSIEDKLGAIQDCRNSIEEWDGIRQEYEYAYYMFIFLENLIDTARYGECGIDIKNYIYAGIEISFPSVEDIVK